MVYLLPIYNLESLGRTTLTGGRFANMDALHEIHRVLKNAGVLTVIWNIDDCTLIIDRYSSGWTPTDQNCYIIDLGPLDWEPTTAWEQKLKDIFWSFYDNDPRFRDGKWQQVFDDQVKTTPFTIQAADPLFSLPLGFHSLKTTVWLSKESIWDRFHTLSLISVLQGQQLEVSYSGLVDLASIDFT